MKIIVCYKLDAAEKVINDISEDQVLVDPDTYYYFRDSIFINEVKEYLKERYPKEFKKIEVKQRIFTGDAVEVDKWYDLQDVIHKHYKGFNKRRQKYYLYNGYIYSYIFIGFGNLGNEIQLFRYDLEDLCRLLNSLSK